MAEWHAKLKAVHGKGKTRQVVNRAIRAGVPGGNETLDSLEYFHKLFTSLQSDRRGDVANIQQMIDLAGVMLDRLNEIRDAMAESVQEVYS